MTRKDSDYFHRLLFQGHSIKVQLALKLTNPCMDPEGWGGGGGMGVRSHKATKPELNVRPPSAHQTNTKWCFAGEPMMARS